MRKNKKKRRGGKTKKSCESFKYDDLQFFSSYENAGANKQKKLFEKMIKNYLEFCNSASWKGLKFYDLWRMAVATKKFTSTSNDSLYCKGFAEKVFLCFYAMVMSNDARTFIVDPSVKTAIYSF